MYKVKRFSQVEKRFGLLGSLFGGNSSKFVPDMGDIEGLSSYRDVIKAFPRLKSPQLDKIIRNQDAIRKLNFEMDDLGVWKDMQVFEMDISDNSIKSGYLNESTAEIRRNLKSNDYLALSYDGDKYLAFEISTSKFITVKYGSSRVSETYSNIGAYIEYLLKELKSVIDNHIEFEMPENEDEIRSMYDKYVKLVK